VEDKSYLFVPQWQDSGNTNELYSGALALKHYFESVCSSPVTDVAIHSSQTSEIENDIFGYKVIKNQLFAIDRALRESTATKIGIIGGGCGVEVPIVSYLVSKYSNLQLIWFDAHADLNSPDSSPSKYFHGMPLRFIVEGQDNEIGEKFQTLDSRNVRLIGTRDLDLPEAAFIKAMNIDLIEISRDYWTNLESKVKKDIPTYIHLDLDVLDPSEYKNVKCPVSKGLSIADLERSIAFIADNTNLVGMSIVENTELQMREIGKLATVFERMIAI